MKCVATHDEPGVGKLARAFSVDEFLRRHDQLREGPVAAEVNEVKRLQVGADAVVGDAVLHHHGRLWFRAEERVEEVRRGGVVDEESMVCRARKDWETLYAIQCQSLQSIPPEPWLHLWTARYAK